MDRDASHCPSDSEVITIALWLMCIVNFVDESSTFSSVRLTFFHCSSSFSFVSADVFFCSPSVNSEDNFLNFELSVHGRVGSVLNAPVICSRLIFRLMRIWECVRFDRFWTVMPCTDTEVVVLRVNQGVIEKSRAFLKKYSLKPPPFEVSRRLESLSSDSKGATPQSPPLFQTALAQQSAQMSVLLQQQEEEQRRRLEAERQRHMMSQISPCPPTSPLPPLLSPPRPSLIRAPALPFPTPSNSPSGPEISAVESGEAPDDSEMSVKITVQVDAIGDSGIFTFKMTSCKSRGQISCTSNRLSWGYAFDLEVPIKSPIENIFSLRSP